MPKFFSISVLELTTSSHDQKSPTAAAVSTGPSSSYSVDQTRRVAFIIIRPGAFRTCKSTHQHQQLEPPSIALCFRSQKPFALPLSQCAHV
jgi:hypothetical protein